MNKNLFEFGFESNEKTHLKYWINGTPQELNIWQSRLREISVDDFNLVQENLIDFWKRNITIQFDELVNEVKIQFSFFEDENKLRYGGLNFELSEKHLVGFNNYLQLVNFQSDKLIQAFNQILEKIKDTIESDKYWNLITQDVVVFEEYIQISSKECFYMGFADKEPFEEPNCLFKLPTNKLKKIIELFVQFIKTNRIEK
ncbi:MAG TPA: hypothetical protein PK147_09540 [Saprospiraceae bacterium]|nr:hypothetical protein [Candidatus Nomurabacteria bacterium]HPQ22081.1 hypothetical protein [Saprospiraceae bacterium]